MLIQNEEVGTSDLTSKERDYLILDFALDTILVEL